MADGSIHIDTQIDDSGLKTGIEKMKGTVSAGTVAIGNLISSAVSKVVSTIGSISSSVVEQGIAFESAFAGVKKTVDATDQQLAQLRSGILDMSKDIPIAATEIAGIAEAAGQLGIETDNILGFTEVMAELGVATNMTAEEAATALARLANITQMPQTEFDKLGSTIVALGNNFATTESEIVDMSLRLAGAGKQVGMSESDIMGLSAALSSVGVQAELGGSAFSRVFTMMQLATEQGGESLEAFASVAGMSASEFKQAFQNDAAQAVVAFVAGLGNAEKSGRSAISVLSEMSEVEGLSSLSTVALSDVLLRAAGASDMMAEAVGLASDAWEENTALTNEAEQRFQTTESKIGLLKNALANIATTLYDSFAPAMNQAIDSFTAWLNTEDAQQVVQSIGQTLSDMFNSIVENLPTIVGYIESFAQALPGILDSVSNALSWVIENIDGIVTGVKAFAIAWAAVKAFNIASGVLNAVKALISFATNINLVTAAQTAWHAITGALSVAQAALNAVMNACPLLLIISGVAALTAGIVGLVNWIGSWGDNTADCNARIETLTQSITPFRDSLSGLTPNIADVNSLTSQMGRTASEVEGQITTAENNITTILQTAMSEQRQLREDEIAQITEYNAQIAELEAEKIGIYQKNLDIVASTLSAQTTMNQEQMAQYVTDAQEAYSQANAAVDSSLSAQLTRIYEHYEQLGMLNSEEHQAAIREAQAAAEQEKAVNAQKYDDIIVQTLNFAQQNIAAQQDMWTQVYANSNKGREQFTANLEQMDLDNTEAFLSMWATAKQAGADIPEETNQMAMNILGSFQNLPSKLEEQGKMALTGLIGGMDDLVPELSDTSEMTCDTIVDTLLEGLDINSPSKVTQGIGQNTIDGLILGMDNKRTSLSSTATSIASGMTQSMTPNGQSVVSIGTNAMGQVIQGIQGKTGLLTSTARSVAQGIISNATPNSTSVKSIGENVMTGIDAGMNNKSSWLGQRVSSLASGLVNKFKSIFGIHSPSTLFRDVIGKNIGLGVSVGIESTEKDVSNALSSLIDPQKAASIVFSMRSSVRDHVSSLTHSSSSISEASDAPTESENYPTAEAIADAIWEKAPEIGVDLDGEKVGNLIEPRVSRIQASKTANMNRRNGLVTA